MGLNITIIINTLAYVSRYSLYLPEARNLAIKSLTNQLCIIRGRPQPTSLTRTPKVVQCKYYTP